MTKYCANCGNPLDENSPVCTKCAAPNPHYVMPGRLPLDKLPIVKNLSPAGKNKFRKKLPIFVGVFVAVVVCLVLLSSFAFGAGYKSVLRSYVKATENEDGQAMTNLMAEAYIDGYSIDSDELARYYEQYLAQKMEGYQNRVGHIVRLRCKIDDFEVMDKRDRDDFVDNNEIMGYDMGDISKVAEVELAINVKGRDKDREFEEELYLVKENGKWKIWGMPR